MGQKDEKNPTLANPPVLGDIFPLLPIGKTLENQRFGYVLGDIFPGFTKPVFVLRYPESPFDPKPLIYCPAHQRSRKLDAVGTTASTQLGKPVMQKARGL